jgi:ABC-2 type transport system ATP-binding protein
VSKPLSNPKSDTAESAALEVFGLGFHYGAKAALSHVGFDVAAGRFKVLLGPNGAGKTKLFSLITRLFESPSGTITVNGDGLREDSLQALARMGVVFQAPAATAAGRTDRRDGRSHTARHRRARPRAGPRHDRAPGWLRLIRHRSERFYI